MKKAHFKLIIANITITTFAKKLLHEPCFLDSDNLVTDAVNQFEVQHFNLCICQIRFTSSIADVVNNMQNRLCIIITLGCPLCAMEVSMAY